MEARKECNRKLSARDEIIASKDKEITKWKLKNDEMAKEVFLLQLKIFHTEFGQMLKVSLTGLFKQTKVLEQTLDKMSERIVISSENYDHITDNFEET